jgi:hypothetical protein
LKLLIHKSNLTFAESRLMRYFRASLTGLARALAIFYLEKAYHGTQFTC